MTSLFKTSLLFCVLKTERFYKTKAYGSASMTKERSGSMNIFITLFAKDTFFSILRNRRLVYIPSISIKPG